MGNGAVCMVDIAAPRMMPALRLGEETSRRVNKIFLWLSQDERCLRSTLPCLRFCFQLVSVPFFKIARFVYCSNTFSPEKLAWFFLRVCDFNKIVCSLILLLFY